MTAAQVYHPRHFSPCGVRTVGPLHAKVYEIVAHGRDAGDVDAAVDHISRHISEDLLANIAATGLGYVLIHRGEAADWLLARTWLEGGIVAGIVYTGNGRTFEKAPSQIIECVWEAVVAFHERDAWVRAGMSVAGRELYLSDMLPTGFY